MRDKSGDKIRLLHILDDILETESYLHEVSFNSFVENSMMRFACIKQLEIIGEARNHISNDIKAKFSSVQWSQIIGMHNIFVHEYFGIDSTLVWEIMKNDLKVLKEKIKAILDSIQ
ncbi:MAG: DUF86 domain-containing protein [Bacteroidota bacterium]|nr:DUF86 domain-containing protein [Bacteroidota bacterium]